MLKTLKKQFIIEFTIGQRLVFGICYERCLSKLIRKAIQLNANALIGIDFDYVNFLGNIIGVIANGTLVKIK